MPNWCDADIYVKGRKMDVDEFINILNADYDYHNMKFSHIPHFYRIFENNVYDRIDNGAFSFAQSNVECAWSVYCCMFPGDCTYYNDMMNDEEHRKRHTNIIEASRKLNLEIEIWSAEPGMCFREHYYIKNGNVLIDEELPYYEFDVNDFNSLQDFNKEYPDLKTLVTEEQFNRAKQEEEFLSINGWGTEEWVMDCSLPDYLYRVEMVKKIIK